VGENLVFAARWDRQYNPLHFNHGGGLGTGGFSLTRCQPYADCAVADPELFGDVAETVTLGLHAGHAVNVGPSKLSLGAAPATVLVGFSVGNLLKAAEAAPQRCPV